jgi:hypothetical protein
MLEPWRTVLRVESYTKDEILSILRAINNKQESRYTIRYELEEDGKINLQHIDFFFNQDTRRLNDT